MPTSWLPNGYLLAISVSLSCDSLDPKHSGIKRLNSNFPSSYLCISAGMLTQLPPTHSQRWWLWLKRLYLFLFSKHYVTLSRFYLICFLCHLTLSRFYLICFLCHLTFRPHLKKTCLYCLPTRSNTNQPAQQQQLAKDL